MATGLTFDTGALIGLERRGHRMRRVFISAVEDGIPITVPSVVLLEWWRGGAGARGRDEILSAVIIEPLDERTAKVAAGAMAAVAGATPVDAVVMASAALRGDTVYTSDFPDLDRLRGYFSAVRLLSA